MTTRKLVINDGLTEKEVLLVGTVSVGRDPACHIHNLDPLLSRRHAEFAWSKDRVTIRDLDSRNGILVNGAKVREQILKSGDVVQAGGLQVRFVESASVTTDEDKTRARERTDTAFETPTVAPTGPIKKIAAQAETETAPVPAAQDPDATFVTASVRLESDDTGVRAGFARAAANVTEVAKVPESRREVDATFAPGSLGRGLAADIDRTLVPARKTSPPPVARPAAEARIVVDRHLVVTSASAGCFELFGVRPETLVGGSAAEVVVQSLTSVAAADGPPAISIAMSRSASDRTITLTFKAGQAVETA